MTINDLAFEMVKNKEDNIAIKKMEKKIKSWEKEKSYPTLEDIYQMAYIMNVNPGELLAIRNRGRKQFYKESDDPPVRKHDWIEISDNASLIFSGLSRLAGLFAFFVFCIALSKFVDTFYGQSGGIVEDQVMLQEIQKSTGHENEIINDGSVDNMVKRIKREANEKLSGNTSDIQNVTESEVVENLLTNQTSNRVNNTILNAATNNVSNTITNSIENITEN